MIDNISHSYQYNTELVANFASIIQAAFSHHFALYYVANTTNSPRVADIDGAVIALLYPVIHCVTLSCFTWPVHEEIFKDGYIVAVDGVESLQILHNLTSGKRVLLFNLGKTDLRAQLDNEYAKDVVIIQQTNDEWIIFSVYLNKTINLTELNYDWRPNPAKTPLINIATFNCPPYSYVTGSGVVADGIDFRVLGLLLRDYRLQFNGLVVPPEKNGYEEVSRLAAEGRSDLSACALFQYESSGMRVDISYPYSRMCVTFLVPRPHLIDDWLFVFRPFTVSVWTVTFLAVASVAILLYTSAQLQLYVSAIYADVVLCFMEALRLYAASAVPVFPKPKQWLTRVLIAGSAASALLLSTGYSAGFTSALTKPGWSAPINDLSDMVEQNIHWGMYEESIMENYRISPRKILVQISKNFHIEANISERNARIKTHSYAVLVELIWGHYLSYAEDLDAHAQQSLKVISECTVVYDTVYVFRDNSPLVDLLNRGVLRLKESGMIAHWFDMIIADQRLTYMDNFFATDDHAGAQFARLEWTKMRGGFFLLLIGYIIGVFVVFIELYTVKYI